MTTTITIADAPSDAQQPATETRAALAAWIESVKEVIQEPPMAALTADQKKALKEQGASVMRARLPNGTDSFVKLLQAFNSALAPLYYTDSVNARQTSYELEGMCNEMSRNMHGMGLKWTPAMEYFALTALQHGMHGNSDLYEWLISKGFQSVGYGMYAPCTSWNSEYDYELDAVPDTSRSFTKHRQELLNRFIELPDDDVCRVTNYASWREYGNPNNKVRREMPNGWNLMPLRYSDVDGDWVAGFLSPTDAARLRFSRKRLGAFLTDAGVYTEEFIRDVVERAKQQASTAQFVLYPNDCLFGEVYTAGVGSCMSHEPGNYESDGMHPTDVYSSSFWGTGDNGLALFTSQDASGKLTGRGIWNSMTGTIVRWYGSQVALRTLQRIDMGFTGEALRGSWLTLNTFMSSGSRRFIHPYVDGDLGYGNLDEDTGRVYLGYSGKFELYETSGSSSCLEQVWCEDADEYYDMDQCTHQEITGYWVYDPYWTCPVIDEWVPEHQRSTVYLDGEEQGVSDYAYHNRLVLTEPSDEMIDEDTDRQIQDGEYDPEDPEDEYVYNGPENYTTR